MKLGWLGILFGAATWLMPTVVASAAEPASAAERLAAEGWAILEGGSIFEPFCDRPAQARDKFMRAIQADPGQASAYRGWGRAVEDLARCPVGGPLTWADTVGLTTPPATPEPLVDLPVKVVEDAALKFRRAADLAPDDPLAWADWGRSLLNRAALEPKPEARLEMVGLAAEKYARAEALAPQSAELRLVQARGLLTVLAVEDDPAAWADLWERTRQTYYAYIDLSPDQVPVGGGVNPRLTAWSVFGREVSQAARDFKEPDKTRLLLGAVIEAMRLLVVAKPDHDLSLDVNSLSQAYLGLMAITPDEARWLELLNQAGGLADRMIELDPDNPVIDFVFWNWRRAAEAEPDPFRRAALIAKALESVALLGEKERLGLARKASPSQAAVRSAAPAPGKAGKGKGGKAAKPAPDPAEAAPPSGASSGRASRFMLVMAAVMERGPGREALLAQAATGFEAAVDRARGEARSRLRVVWAQELMALAALEPDPQVFEALVDQAGEQYRLSLENASLPGQNLISWADATAEATTVAVTSDRASAAEAGSANNRPEGRGTNTVPENQGGATVSAVLSENKNGATAAAASSANQGGATAAAVSSANQDGATAAAVSAGNQAGSTPPAAEPPPPTPAGLREKYFDLAVEKYKVAAALPGGEKAFDYLGALYFRRAQTEKDPARAEEFWLKALENFRRATLPGEEEAAKTELSFRLGLIYATLAAQGPAAAQACLKDSGHGCLVAAMRVQREVFTALPADLNRSVSAGGAAIHPDFTPALRPRPDPTRLGPGLSLARPANGDAAARRRQALTRTAADGFFQILLAVDLSAPPPPRRTPSTLPAPPPERRARLQGSDRALLAALYRLAAGYRQMDPDYKAIYLRRAESL